MNHKLVEMGLKRWHAKYVRDIDFAGTTITEAKAANELIKNIGNFPQALVLAGLMDRQISAEKAWIIPYRIKEIRGGVFDIKELVTLSEVEYINIFEKNKLHRFNKNMAIVFHKAVNRIQDEYGGDVSKIWTGKPSSAKVVFEFSLFYGCGIKISTMLANILVPCNA